MQVKLWKYFVVHILAGGSPVLPHHLFYLIKLHFLKSFGAICLAVHNERMIEVDLIYCCYYLPSPL